MIILRNFKQRNERPFFPMRRCIKKTGPFESNMINRLMIGNNQINTQPIKSKERTISKLLFNER